MVLLSNDTSSSEGAMTDCCEILVYQTLRLVLLQASKGRSQCHLHAGDTCHAWRVQGDCDICRNGRCYVRQQEQHMQTLVQLHRVSEKLMSVRSSFVCRKGPVPGCPP